MKINLFWFRRDLRLDDNPGLDSALMAGLPVLVLFIFDTNITEDLPPDDPRIGFIYESLGKINRELVLKNGSLCILKGDPLEEFGKLLQAYSVDTVYANRDYEPYPAERDSAVSVFLKKHDIRFLTFKDHVIYEKDEVVKQDKSPYRVFTPYKNAWLKRFAAGLNTQQPAGEAVEGDFVKSSHSFPSLEQLGFRENQTRVGPYDLSVIKDYGKYRNFPAADRTSRLSPHLRFGTVSIRKIVSLASATNQVFLEELIWREFFMQILFHFPAVVTDNFRPSFNRIRWRNNESEFRRWCNGETGYPIVDAGMRQLNLTGFMHNRVRMITAGFLCKHLLTDWRFGEAYFASKLLDYELSSNNGNWQWAAGTGCDAAQYFRIFNPLTQERKFDPSGEYTGKWVPEKRSPAYQAPVVDHTFARERAMEAYHISMKEF